MTHLPRNPVVYEINTGAWLGDLSRQAGHPVTLSSVPVEAWEAIASWQIDAVWLMGIWERSPASLQITLQDAGLMAEFRRVLPDFSPEDMTGSPYSVRQYDVDPHFGGWEGLAAARQALAERGIGLLLDFVPNHVSPDHPWVKEHLEYFIRGEAADLEQSPAEFRQVGEAVFARGRDPYFPPWHDLLQLNAFDAGLRKAEIETLNQIAGQCDGVRCDVAMLLLTDVFASTWGKRAGPLPACEFWAEVIPAVKAKHPEFIFIAEAYWDKEWELQQQGFDYCYDKRLYDRLVLKNAEAVRGHLLADPRYQARLVRFIENHDEPRAAATFSPAEERLAAVVTATQMGMRLFHEGQFEGRKVKLPVFLTRRPAEPLDAALQKFYRKLLSALGCDALQSGEWRLCTCTGWPDNNRYQNLAAWAWLKPDELVLVVVNLSEVASQGRVQVPWEGAAGRGLVLTDLLSGDIFPRAAGELREPGLFVDLPPWGVHLLKS